jgi:DNA-binding NtrC family response regulator
MEYVGRHIGPDYAWPGNVRELEQCVRNVMIRGEYHPTQRKAISDAPGDRMRRAIQSGDLSAEELLRCYCTLVYGRTRNYRETARRLGLDHRTVKSHVVPAWLADSTGEQPPLTRTALLSDRTPRA